MSARQVTLGDSLATIPEFSGRKAIRGMTLLKAIAEAAPELLKRRAQFIREYGEQNVEILSRAEAMWRFGPAPLTRFNRETEQVELLREDDGTVIMGPPRLAHLSDADWERSGNQLRMSEEPPTELVVAALFPYAFEQAETQVLQLLALVTIGNREYGEAVRSGQADKLLADKADALQDELAHELMELAVTAVEVVQEQFADRIDTLRKGNRLGKLLALFGVKESQVDEPLPRAETESSTSRLTSSTDSPAPTDGTRAPSSTAPAGDSSSDSQPV